MKYAYNQDGVLVDVVMTNPYLLFSEGYASQFIEVPDDCITGWLWDGEKAVAPPEPDWYEILSRDVRSQRNEKLAACDWTQVPDATVDRQAWATYRQALRDLTVQDGFPFTFEWPINPDGSQ